MIWGRSDSAGAIRCIAGLGSHGGGELRGGGPRVKHALTQVDVIPHRPFRGFAGYWEIRPPRPPKRANGLPGPRYLRVVRRNQSRAGQIAHHRRLMGLIAGCHRASRKPPVFWHEIVQFAFGGDGNREFLPHNFLQLGGPTPARDNTAVGWWKNAPQRDRVFAAAYLQAQTDRGDAHWPMMRATITRPTRGGVPRYGTSLDWDLNTACRTHQGRAMGMAMAVYWHEVGENRGRLAAVTAAVSGRGAIGLLRA